MRGGEAAAPGPEEGDGHACPTRAAPEREGAAWVGAAGVDVSKVLDLEQTFLDGGGAAPEAANPNEPHSASPGPPAGGCRRGALEDGLAEVPCAFVGCGWRGPPAAYPGHVAVCRRRPPPRAPPAGAGGSPLGEALRPAAAAAPPPAAQRAARRSAAAADAAAPVAEVKKAPFEASLTRRRRAPPALPPAAAREACGPAYRVRAPRAEAPPCAEAAAGAAAAEPEAHPPVAEEVLLRLALRLSAARQQQAASSQQAEPEAEPCGLCLEPLSRPAGTVTALPSCGHSFHLQCLLATHAQACDEVLACPLCRAPSAWGDLRLEEPAADAAAPTPSCWEELSPPSPRPPRAAPPAGGGQGGVPAPSAAAAAAPATAAAAAPPAPGPGPAAARTPQAFAPPVGSGGAAPARAWRAARWDPRAKAIRAIFAECDVDGDGRLGLLEFRTFAVESGFDGDDGEWAEEYAAVCGDHGVDPARGFNEATFSRLVDTDSDTGVYCTEEELQAILRRLRATRGWRRASPQPAGAAPAPAAPPAPQAPQPEPPPGLAGLPVQWQ